jgi:nicotinate-nucleotide adenylyltransferase
LALPTRARLAAALGGHLPVPGQRIGLLGGSFNPAHEAHLAISREALHRLGLDRVWWLVSPQNPLKASRETEALGTRLDQARTLSRDPRILAGTIESVLGTVYTVDTLAALVRRFPRVHFVWLMGADNLIQIPAWKSWQELFRILPVAVFDRPSYHLEALAGKAARRFACHRLPESRAGDLARRAPPAWVFIHQGLNPQSSTRIRAARKSRAKRPI